MSESSVPNTLHKDSDDEDTYENASSNLPTNFKDDAEKTNEEIINNIIGKQANLDLNDDDDDDGDDTVEHSPPAPKSNEELDKRREFENTLSSDELLERKQKAIDFKTTGNTQFKGEDYLGSVDSYTAGLEVCPLNQTEDRSVLFGNRAAAHIQLGNKTVAIQDCTDSLDANPKYIKVLLR